jgi:hypothetical protein
MRRAVLVAFGLLLTREALAQQDLPNGGWTRSMTKDQRHYLWSNADSEGRGATAYYNCRTDGFEIVTKESLLTMADVDDGQIKVALLCAGRERLVVNGYLSRDQVGVIFQSDGSDELRDWLQSSAGQMVTILLSNNGRQETYSFSNTNTTTAPGVLSCDKPPKPQK